MEGIELRDFAVEHAERQIAESIADLEQLERRRSECSGWRRFWRTYVRITIHEAECRDHLGTRVMLTSRSPCASLVFSALA